MFKNPQTTIRPFCVDELCFCSGTQKIDTKSIFFFLFNISPINHHTAIIYIHHCKVYVPIIRIHITKSP